LSELTINQDYVWQRAPILPAADAPCDSATDLADKRPLVSVIIPVFNREKSLATALRSVADQTFADWEVVVVDDCSSDNSAEVALRVGQPGKVRVVRHESNLGSSAARNTGILAARGRYVSFLDSDDSWHPEKLGRQVELTQADSNPDMVLCVTQTSVIRGGGRAGVLPKRAPLPKEPWSEFLYMKAGFAQSNTFFLSRELAMRVGFRSKEPPHEDHLFFLDLGALGARYQLVPEPLSNWNDDLRPDRLCLGNTLERSRRYLDEAGSLMTDQARLAFQVRVLGPLLLKENPHEAVKVFREAVRIGAVRRHHLLFVVARWALPASTVGLLRRMIYLLKS